MKKILILFAMALVLFVVACDNQTTTTTSQSTQTTTTNQTTTDDLTTTTTMPTTTAQPYDDRSLVPDSCSYLDNIDDWQPVWCDEFDVDGLPSSERWSYDVGGGGWGNNEDQYYTNADLDNAFVSEGTLKIRAVKEDISGYDYSSARLISKYRGDWLYGRIQIRAKMPTGRGTWAALWMLPTDWRYGGWPDSGEIDIMEYVGYDPDEIHGTIHTGAYNHSLGTQIGYSRTVDDAENSFHIYEMVWEPRKIELFIDGVKFATFGYNPLFNIDTENSDAWPFDQRFHLIMNLAIGGNWGGVQGVDDSIFPTQMEVDYVRVYQKDYAGLDSETPTAINDLSLLKSEQESIKLYWDHATDDVMGAYYEIYVDSVLDGTTTLNAYTAHDLDPSTSYRFDVVAVDFAGRRSESRSVTVSTEAVVSILDGIVEAEDYVNQSGVFVQVTDDEGGGQNVGWIDTNDYMEYTLLVPESGNYTLTYRVASESGGGEIKFYASSLLPLATTAIPATGGWQVWTDVTTESFYLSEGVYTFRIRASVGGFNLNYFEFKQVTTVTTT